MINPCFIVDGQMEQKIINYFCPDHPVRLLNCNGRDVSFEAAGKRAASLIRLMKKHFPVIIIFDREKRKESSTEVERKLHEEITKSGIHDVIIYIGVPDFMMENWMLADIHSINSYFDVAIKQKNFEGTGGKGQLRKLIEPKNYSETEDGPEIIKRCNPNVVYKNSNSFKIFYDIIKDLHCKKLKVDL